MLRRNRSPEAIHRARMLRREMTPPERILWSRLRDPAIGLRFRRQHPLGPYVLDFYCPSANACVEVDGMHAHDGLGEWDAIRDALVLGSGIRTMRVQAADVFRDVEGVVERIVAFCEGGK